MNPSGPGGDAGQGGGVPPGLDPFIARWAASSGAERANYQLFLAELCDVLHLPRPDPSVADESTNTYVYDKAVAFPLPDGRTTTKYIDLYRKGCFVCETKQSVERPERDPLSVADPAAPKARRKTGTSVRGTAGWDTSMIAARGQAEDYVRGLADDNPPFLLIIDIGHSFELYADFSRLGKVYTAFPDARSHRFSLDSLRDEAVRETLRKLWLDPLSLDPSKQAARVTREIAGRIAILARRLEAAGHDPEGVAWFLIRCLFSFFAEDVGLLPKGTFTDLLVSLRATPAQFVPLVTEVWRTMDTGGFSAAIRSRLKRFNGGIFHEHEPLKLDAEEIGLLIDAGKCDWQDVEPAIFGTLLERALDPRERHKLGAHFTPRAYVERLVVPTIIEPVRDDWEAARAASLAEATAGRIDAAKSEARKFLDDLTGIRVLDPACGTGNFLYVSMVKLKEIEAEARDWLGQLGETQADLEHMERTIDPKQFLGLEINPRAVVIAEVVLWIGWLQWHLRDRKKPESFSEPILHAYGNIECRDALLAYDRKELVRDDTGKPVTRWDGVTTKKHPVTGEDVPDDSSRVAVERYVNPRKATWPKADYVVGNPPFLGSKRMRECLGDAYVDAIQATWPEVPQATDFVLRWWHKAAELLREGNLRVFGLVTTNSIGQAYNRRAIQSHLDSGQCNLTFAIPDHPWVDSADGAAVRIAMTVGKRTGSLGLLVQVVSEHSDEKHEEVSIETHSTPGCINASLQIGADTGEVTALTSNADLCCVGIKTIGGAFVVTPDEAERLGRSQHLGLDRHIRPYLNGRDISQTSRDLMVIDLFGLSDSDVQSRFPELYQHLLHGAKPEREQNRNRLFREVWWVIGHPRPLFREFTQGINRYIATIETSKHRFFVFLSTEVLPDSTAVTFGLGDAVYLGVMSSRIHVVWSLAAGGRLGVGNDPRYNKTACFDPFPFPDATDAQRQHIRELGEALDAHRKRQQQAHPGLTITGMYNVLEKLRSGEPLTAKEKKIHDDGLVSVLRKIHDDLDAAVFEAYGWPLSLSDDEILERLVALNHERAAEEKRGLVRWLRPEFQSRGGASDVQLAMDVGDDADEDVEESGEAAESKPKRRRGGGKRAAKKSTKKKPPAKAERLAWPKDLAEQTRAVRGALAAAGEIVTAAEVAKQFAKAKAARVEEILDTLVALGHARHTDAGYASV